MDENTTRVFLLNIQKAEKYDEEYFRAYFPTRLEQSRRFRFPEDRLRSLSAGILLHEVLGLEEKTIEIAPGGKPRAKSGEVEFNLSHSGDYASLAVSAKSVGVDIEKKELRHVAVAKSVFQAEELRYMEENPAERFTNLWTMKEAVSKALGLGLQLKFREMNVLPLFRGESITVGERKIFGSCLSVPGYSLSVCTVDARQRAEMEYL